jgi:hypothetical protein
MSKKAVFGGFIVGVIVAFIAVEYLRLNVQILHNVGLVKSNIGVYWDESATNVTTQIDWGTLYPGSEKTVVVFIENAKNTTMTVYLQTSNWIPSQASNYISLSWNSSGYVPSNNVAPVSLTLSAGQNIVGVTSFSFDLIITGQWE